MATKKKNVGNTADTVNEVKEQIKKEELAGTELTPEQEEILIKCLEEAKMPVKLEDKDFTLGERELDIRNLSNDNTYQMFFRMQILNVVYQRQLTQNLVDIERLLMLVLKKLGVEDVVKETDDLLSELAEKVNGGNKNKMN